MTVNKPAKKNCAKVHAFHAVFTVLTILHWLPVRKRVMFKTVVFMARNCLNLTAPGYLSELCVPVASASGRQHLRSASTGILQVQRARTTIGQRNFAVTGPSQCNNLPAVLRMILHTSKRRLNLLSVAHLMCWRTEGTFQRL